MIDYTGSSTPLQASDYKTLEIVYMIPTSNKTGSYVTDLFLCTGSKMNPDGSERTRADLINDGEYHTLSVDLSARPFWSGAVNRSRFDYFGACTAGDVMYVQWIGLQ